MALTWLHYAGIVCVSIGAAVAVYTGASNADGWILSLWSRYTRTLHRELRFLFLPVRAESLAGAQSIASVIMVCGWLWFESVVWILVLIPIVVLPAWWLEHARKRRIDKLEQQLDGWLTLMSNALRVAPSVGDALQSSRDLVRAPLSQELDLVLKQIRLGSAVDEALLSMSSRVTSPSYQGALSAILIGRQTGGNLSDILDQNARALREMARLEGVIRTKTASGRSQVYFLSAFPFVVVAALHQIDPEWLYPLTHTLVGWGLVIAAACSWLMAIVLARRVMAVDI